MWGWSMYCTVYCIVIRFPATRSAHPAGSNLGPGGLYTGRTEGGRSPCEYCTNKVKNTRPRLTVSEKKRKKKN